MEWSTETCSQTILSAKNKIYINNDELTNVIIENDYENNRIMFPEQEVNISENDIFLSTLKKAHEQHTFSKQADVEAYLKKKRKLLADKLSQAYYFYESKSYMKALDCFEESIRIIENDCYPDEYQLMPNDIFAIKYCIALCNLRRMEYGSLQSAVSQLKNLIEDQDFGKRWPVLYLSLAEVHFALKHHELCSNVLKTGLKILGACNSFVSPNWPGTNNVIIELDISQLQLKMNELLKEATLPNVPDAYCCYSSCHLVGNSQRAIYFDSPSFDGYSILCCTENCKFYYHRQCWRRYTRDVRKNGKDAINGPCPTPNCTGYLNSFQIFDESGKLKSSKESTAQHNVSVDEDNSSVCSYSSKKEYSACRPDNLFYKNQLSKCSEDILKSDSDSINQTLNVDVPEFLPGQKYISSESCTSSENSFKVGICQTEKLIMKTITTQTNNPTNEVCTQASCNSVNKSIQTIDKFKNDEIKLLKTHIESLNSSLFETEHNYNLLLNEKKCPCCKRSEIKTVNAAVQFESNEIDTNDKNLILKMELNQYKTKCIQLKNQFDEVNKELSKIKLMFDMQLREKEQLIQDLNNKISSLQILNVELNKQRSEKDELVDRLRKSFYQEQHYSRSVYNHFLTTFTDKCNRILWELNQIEPLLNPHTCPTISEVKTAQSNWLRSQSYTVQFTQCINKYYDDQLTAYWTADSKETRSSVQRPSSVLPHEPPNLFIHYFRVVLQDNFRLHDNLQRVNWPTRKNMPPQVLNQSRPYRPPLLGPYPMPQFLNQPQAVNNERFKFNEKISQNQNLEKSKMSHIAKVEAYERDECKEEKFDCNSDLDDYKETSCLANVNKSDLHHNLTHFTEKSNYCLKSENFNDNSNEESNSNVSLEKIIEEQQKDSFKDEVQNTSNSPVSENELIGKTSFKTTECIDDEEFTEDICRTNLQEEQYFTKHSSLNHSDVEYNEDTDNFSQVSRNVEADVYKENFLFESTKDDNVKDDFKSVLSNAEVNRQIKLHSQMTTAMNKIKEKFFPDIPMENYLEAIAILRSSKGKLSGMSMKIIREELHKILYEDHMQSERGDSESIKSNINKQVWASVGLPEWSREQDINCPICFEFMSQEGTSELTCGHKYHSSCIKIWLDSNSICPICRLYTTNEEDFPPLK